MNEVRVSSVVSPMVVRPASSKDGVEQSVTAVNPAAATSPAVTSQEPPKVAPPTRPEPSLADAVEAINQYVQSVNRDLQFTVDEELDRTVIKVVDSESGQLIRQIPDEVLLELAKRLNDGDELHLIDALG